jgi:hypothetical protein
MGQEKLKVALSFKTTARTFLEQKLDKNITTFLYCI